MIISGGSEHEQIIPYSREIDDVEGRRVAIRDFLDSTDISDILPEEASVSEEKTMQDRMCFPFVVGNKYLKQTNSKKDEYPAYLLGIIRAGEDVSLLVVEPGSPAPKCVERAKLQPPVVIANRKYMAAQSEFAKEIMRRSEEYL